MRNTETSSRDAYLTQLFEIESEPKKQSRQAAEKLGLERISVSPAEARIIALLMKMYQCRKCIEVGTLTGLSAQYIFGALPPGGELWTFEKNEEHAAQASKIFSKLDQSSKRIYLIVGDAKEKLEGMSSDGPFDAIFIDGNKAAYGDYLAWAEKNIRVGGLIIADNVFLSGAVWGESTIQKFNEKQIQVMQKFNQRLANKDLYESVILPTQEGLFVAIKKT